MSEAFRGGIFRVIVVMAVLVGAFAFSSGAEAAGSSVKSNVTAAAQNCDDVDCGDYLGDSGIGCINGEVVGDVNGSSINCDVDGDVGGTAINGDVTGNVGSCINGDVGGSSGTTINCGVGNSAPEPYGPGGPNPETPGVTGVPNVPGSPSSPGAPGAPSVVALPSTGAGQMAVSTDLSALVLVIAAFGLVAAAGLSAIGRRGA